MFERFIKLGMKHVTLSLQHRMRPEVARLIAPAIYQSLRNHSSVLKYPDVKGVKKNVFFLAHEVLEKAVSTLLMHYNLQRLSLEEIIFVGKIKWLPPNSLKAGRTGGHYEISFKK